MEALQRLTHSGIDIYVVTNQAGIAKGIMTEEEYHRVTGAMLEMFGNRGICVRKVLHCPHHPEGIVPQFAKQCLCRKPETGMLREVMELGGYRSEEVALVGDKETDIEAGNRMGWRTYLVRTGYGEEHRQWAKPTRIVADLAEAVRDILNCKGGTRPVVNQST